MKTSRLIIIGLIIILGAAWLIASVISSSTVSASSFERIVEIDRSPAKIASLKHDLLVRLSQCENPAQNPGKIVFDNNESGTLTGQNIPSIGLMMFKINTVKAAVALETGATISDAEAVALAIDPKSSLALAEFVIFSGKDKKGVEHWLNCSNKLGLKQEVALIKKFEQ